MPANDSTLLTRWTRDRDAEAFAEIVARHSAMVYATCTRILRDPTEAEDVTQECFLKLTTFRRPRRQSLGGLLHSLATNEAINRLKARSRRTKREQRYASNAPVDPGPQWEDISNLVDEAIAQLPERLQYPLVAHFLEGRTQVAIAQELSLDESTVRYRIRKGIGLVRTFLKKRGVTITTAALATLLSSNAAQAAPATLCATLGKIAIAGAHSAPAAISSTAALTTLGATVLMTKKVALIVTGLAIVVAAGYGGLSLKARMDSPDPRDVALVEPNTELEMSPEVEFARSSVATGQDESAAATVQDPDPPSKVIEPESALGTVLTALGGTLGLSEDTLDSEPTPVSSSDVPADNGMHFFLLAAELFNQDDLDYISEKWLELGPEAWRDPEIQALMMAYQDAFDAIREGLEVGNAMLPFFEHAFYEPLPYLASWRALARMMTMEAAMHGSQGDYGSAFDQYLMLIEFGNESANGGSAINGLVGYVMRNAAVEALRDAITGQPLAAADYESLIAQLLALGQETFALAVGETENLDLWLDAAEDPMQELLQVQQDMENPLNISMYSEQELANLWQEFLEHREVTIAYAELPYYEIQAIDFDAIYGENPFSLLLLPSYVKFSAATSNTQAQVLGTALVAAIEWYHGDQGVYPSSLAQLAPQYIPTLPADPFTGGRFHFDSHDSGYLLYSTGKDMTDDGGIPWDVHITWQDGKDVVLHDS